MTLSSKSRVYHKLDLRNGFSIGTNLAISRGTKDVDFFLFSSWIERGFIPGSREIDSQVKFALQTTMDNLKAGYTMRMKSDDLLIFARLFTEPDFGKGWLYDDRQHIYAKKEILALFRTLLDAGVEMPFDELGEKGELFKQAIEASRGQ